MSNSATSLGGAAERWLNHLAIERGLSANTLSNYRRECDRYVAYLATKGITLSDEPTDSDVSGYVAALRRGEVTGMSLAVSSTNRALVVVRNFHRFLVSEGLAAQDPSARILLVKQSQKLPDTLSVDEVDRLITAAGSVESDDPIRLRDRALLEMLYGTGGRISEIVTLTVDDIDRGCDVVFLTGKGNKQRIVPLGRQAKKAIDAYVVRGRPSLNKRGRPELFLNTLGRPLSRQSSWAIIRNAAQRAGIDSSISPHTLRHCYATHLLQGGADVRVVQELLGHAAVTTTQIYTHVTAQGVREMFAASHPRAR